MPRPRRVKTSPGCVPAGMVSSSRPSSVGTSIDRSQGRLGIGDRHLADQVPALAVKQRVLLHVDDAIAVAGRTAARDSARLRRAAAVACPVSTPAGISTLRVHIAGHKAAAAAVAGHR